MRMLTKFKSGRVIFALLLLVLCSGKSWGQSVYQLVTSETELVAGESYLIVNMENKQALGTKENNYRNQASVQISNNQIQDLGTDVCVLVLGGNASSGWTFYDAANDGYLQAASNSSNYMKTGSLGNNCYASITFSGNDANIVFDKGDYSRNRLQYNKSNTRFSCYP